MEKRVEGIILQMHKRRLEYADQRGGGGAGKSQHVRCK